MNGRSSTATTWSCFSAICEDTAQKGAFSSQRVAQRQGMGVHASPARTTAGIGHARSCKHRLLAGEVLGSTSPGTLVNTPTSRCVSPLREQGVSDNENPSEPKTQPT